MGGNKKKNKSTKKMVLVEMPSGCPSLSPHGYMCRASNSLLNKEIPEKKVGEIKRFVLPLGFQEGKHEIRHDSVCSIVQMYAISEVAGQEVTSEHFLVVHKDDSFLDYTLACLHVVGEDLGVGYHVQCKTI